MALIPIEDMTTLIPASEAKTVADSAMFEHEKQTVAAVINNAANTGAHFAVWQHPMSDELKALLESNGYIVQTYQDVADPRVTFEIRGF